MNNLITASEIEKLFDRVRREVYIALENSRPGERVTIFLSIDLYRRLEVVHQQEILHHSDVSRIKLFGCNVETYIDNGLSFYVTTARKMGF